MSDEVFVLRLRWHMAALKVQLELLRLGLVLRAYNPGQPRVPAGTPHGGRWVDDDPSGTDGPFDGARVIPASDSGSSRYRVDLAEEEEQGHTLRDHVGKTDDAMMERVSRSGRDLRLSASV